MTEGIFSDELRPNEADESLPPPHAPSPKPARAKKTNPIHESRNFIGPAFPMPNESPSPKMKVTGPANITPERPETDV